MPLERCFSERPCSQCPDGFLPEMQCSCGLASPIYIRHFSRRTGTHKQHFPAPHFYIATELGTRNSEPAAIEEEQRSARRKTSSRRCCLLSDTYGECLLTAAHLVVRDTERISHVQGNAYVETKRSHSKNDERIHHLGCEADVRIDSTGVLCGPLAIIVMVAEQTCDTSLANQL